MPYAAHQRFFWRLKKRYGALDAKWSKKLSVVT